MEAISNEESPQKKNKKNLEAFIQNQPVKTAMYLLVCDIYIILQNTDLNVHAYL